VTTRADLQHHGLLHAFRADNFVLSHRVTTVDAELVSGRRRPLISHQGRLVHGILLSLVHWSGRSTIDRSLTRGITVRRIHRWGGYWRLVAYWTNPFVGFRYPHFAPATLPAFFGLLIWPVQVNYPT